MGESVAGVGSECYLIGGSVRDLLLRRITPDIDIAVEGSVEQITERVAECIGARVCKTTEFMTAKLVLEDGTELDIARTRREDYPEPAALPVVAPADLQADLERRDFTINAMAMCIAPERFGELIDPLEGREDLRTRRVRVLHDRSFVDDPTRLYRAVRFMLRLDFHLEEHTRRLLREGVERRFPALLSGARIRNELRVIFRESVADALSMLRELRLFEATELHGISEAACRAASRIPNAGRALGIEDGCVDPMTICLGLHCALSRAEPEALAARLMLGRGARRGIAQIVRTVEDPPEALETAERDSELHFALRGISPETAIALWTVVGPGARERLEHHQRILHGITADIDGTHLMQAGYEPGPGFAAALDAALAAKLDDSAGRDGQLHAAKRALDDALTDGTV